MPRMSSDAKWIAVTVLGSVLAAALGLAALILQQSNHLQNGISGIDDRLRSVEVTQGRILERLGQREPAPEAVSQELAKHDLDNL